MIMITTKKIINFFFFFFFLFCEKVENKSKKFEKNQKYFF